MTRKTFHLNDSAWQFGPVSPRPFTAANVNDLSQVRNWRPATVPGNVRSDLLALGQIADPFVAENYRDSLWVEAVDWWYRRDLEFEPLAANQQAFLSFDGIDYLAAVFLNGRELARYEGMFSRRCLDLTGSLQSGHRSLAVRLWGSNALPRRLLTLTQRAWQGLAGRFYRSWAGIYPDRSATLKSQMSFGWDFAPPIRAMGLWDEARLVITGPVAILDASAISRVETTTSALVSILLSLKALVAGRAAVSVTIEPANFTGPAQRSQFQLDVSHGHSEHRLDCHLSDVRLWQPWDRGLPHLYRVTVRVSPSTGPADEVTFRTGVRTVEVGLPAAVSFSQASALQPLPPWQFRLNGQREFIRGLNWVPADSLPGRLRRADYEQLLGLARDSGANLLRVWGGGLREKPAFYDLCDELGLLVWQEFPFACMFLGSYPRQSNYLALVEAEAGAIVRQTRHHPSLVVWCGGNEFSRWRNRPLLKTLQGLVQQLDGTRPFIPASPGPGDAHNWDVWHGDAPLPAYQHETAPFVSEFGLQALPSLDTLQAILADPSDPRQWSSHQADLKKLSRYAAPFLANTLTPSLNLPSSNLPAVISASQRAQATGLQLLIERMRRRKGQAGGLCLWQFNEPWPAVSWAIVDYFRRPKLAYERLKTWYAPLLVCLDGPPQRAWQAGDEFEATIWAINDSLAVYSACRLRVELDHRLIHEQALEIEPDSARPVGSIRQRLTSRPHQVDLRLSFEGRLLCHNFYALDWVDFNSGSRLLWLKRRIAELVLR
ncbi:MAG TPA: glycoside hydrolase family 2 TIM barrel-domain containing protein [Anaerolineae bacterium]|nr:glycoside hydrolase family 2 TIM barrel-domain containing protein [Anaerolineae bacterium]